MDRRYTLRGDPNFEAVRVDGELLDGQAPFLFTTGEWDGKRVYVEPYKMWLDNEECEDDAVERIKREKRNARRKEVS